MLRSTFGTSLFVLASAGAFAQPAAAPPSFEVASVRVSTIGKAGGEGSRRENIQTSPDSLTMRNVSLKSAIRWAYHVFDYQVSGPDWLQSERYDINAKSAGTVNEDQLRLMLQVLLADRFKLEVHHQTKEFSAYVLLVGKGGPKVHESKEDGEFSMQPDQKRMVVTVQHAPVSQLTEMLSNIFRAPVVDQTDLKGRYDLTINVAKYLSEMQPTAGGAPPDPLSLITMGLQEELGLKLESKKMNLDLVVVDHAEKVPVEN
ncbi:MAG TPA: TIGR03435 family protein [Bryobacteraceae bacterium]|nr:TIGR03435 family protein [Bryobacteraceae bacterium]